MGEPGRVAGRTEEEIQRRCIEAMKLRREGNSYREIGEALGVTPNQAYADVLKELRRVRKEEYENVEEMRILEAKRLDWMLTRLAKRVDAGDDDAIELSMKIMTRRSKLFGVDTPVVKKLELSDVRRPTDSDKALLLRAEQLRAKIDGLVGGRAALGDGSNVVDAEIVPNVVETPVVEGDK